MAVVQEAVAEPPGNGGHEALSAVDLIQRESVCIDHVDLNKKRS